MGISTTAKYIGIAGLVMATSMNSWAAARFTTDPTILGSVAPIVLSNTDLSTPNVKGYRPWFESGAFQGDLVQYSISASGSPTTSVNLTGTSPVNVGSPPANWSALLQFKAAETSNPNYWDTGRKIISWNGSAQKAFRFTTATIGDANREALDKVAFDAASTTSDILNFLRGATAKEFPTGSLRNRVNTLGAIIHSKPVYVAAPTDGRTDNDYATWAAGKKNRAARVYVGANDGMLHVFDAANGNEVYAYVPSMLMSTLRQHSAKPYDFTPFVDGELTVRDAYFGGTWHTVLVGTLGAGGRTTVAPATNTRGFFALDITDPGLTAETANTGNDKKVLWEVKGSGDNDLGDGFSRAVIAKLNDGKWYAVIGNGYNSTNGIAMLYIVNLETGAITRKVSTGSGAAASPNGLSSPSLVDTNRDGKADYAYAGDIDGNVWKFDLTSSAPLSWAVAYSGTPLHPSPGAGAQPVVIAPQIAPHPNEGYMVYFATGRLFDSVDKGNAASVDALFGVWDKGTAPPNKADQKLQAVPWSGPKTYNYTKAGVAKTQTIGIYHVDPGDVNWATKHGWKIAFPAGYRVLQPLQVRANRVVATVHNPIEEDVPLASPARKSTANWLVEAAITDGGPHPTPVFDLNQDAELTGADRYDNDPSPAEQWHVPMVWRRAYGLMSQVTIARYADGVDSLLINYLEQPVPQPCTGVCADGFQGGHIDVDTWVDSAAYAGVSTKHNHEYDKSTARVYVDFFDLNVPETSGPATALRKDVTGQVEIDSTGVPAPSSTIAGATEFIVLVTNADFSPGATLQIGTKKWNVVEYQRQIHEALRTWNPTVAGTFPTDASGASLVFTWNAIKAAGGTISNSFDDAAIRNGGLHPTQTGCVKDSAYNGLFTVSVANGTTVLNNVPPNLVTPQVGRWRNGALTLQLIKKSAFTVNPAISQVLVQKPSDLVHVVTLANGTQIKLTADYNTDGDSNDLYEKIGGLIVNPAGAGPTNHIWESTLFWHFGDLSSAVYGVKPCYGSKDWAKAVSLEVGNNAINRALVAAGLADVTLDNIEAKRIEYAACAAAKDATCVTKSKLLEAIYKLLEDYEDDSSDDPGDGDGEEAVIMLGDAVSEGLTSGPQFDYGRMSWTDLVN